MMPIRCSLALIALAFSSTLLAQTASYKDNPEFQKKFAEAQRKEHDRKERFFAADDYWSALKISGNQCTECLVGVMRASLSLNDYKQVFKGADAMEKLPVADNKAKSMAKFMRATAMMRKDGQELKSKTASDVLPILQEAEKLDPANQRVHYQQGKVLALLGRKDEASAQFREYLKVVPANDPLRNHVKVFAKKPELSLEKMVPPFTLTDINGKRFSLDAMGGKVVLIDVWATWCGPCNAELPHLKNLAKEFKNEPFTILSISVDKDENAWRKFVAKNEMTWIQFHDRDHILADALGGYSIPRYYTIDSDGILQSVNVGSGSDIDGRLRKLVEQAKKNATEQTDEHGE